MPWNVLFSSCKHINTNHITRSCLCIVEKQTIQRFSSRFSFGNKNLQMSTSQIYNAMQLKTGRGHMGDSLKRHGFYFRSMRVI